MTKMCCLLFSAVICMLLCCGTALECYTCSSHIGIPNSLNECESFHYYDNHKKSVCLAGDQVCAKYIINHDGMTWIHRSCRPYDICTYLRSVYSNSRDQLLECSTCSDSNLCNSGSGYAGSMLVILIAFSSLKIIY